MPWITLTSADLLQNLGEAEVNAYRSYREADQADPISGILADVTAEVRGYVGQVVELAGTTGIPHALKNAALDLAAYRLCKRVFVGSEAQRKPAADDAVTLLQRAAAGDFALDVDEGSSSSGNWGSHTNIFG